MKTIQITQNTYQEIEKPTTTPTAYNLLVKVKATGINPIDTKLRQRKTEPFVAGYDACGIVEATGEKVTLFKKGDRIYYSGNLQKDGSNAEYQLVDERLVALAPHNLSNTEAAALPLTALTAYEALFERLRLPTQNNKNKTLLIINGAGGVGSIAIQLAKWAGLTVVATASRPESQMWCKKMGADHIIDHKQDLKTQLQNINITEVDAIFCTIYIAQYWDKIPELLKLNGGVCYLDDSPTPLNINLYKPKNQFVVWEFMAARPIYQTPDMIQHHRILKQVAQLIEQNIIQHTLTQTLKGLTTKNIQKAHQQIETGTTIGKIVIELKDK